MEARQIALDRDRPGEIVLHPFPRRGAEPFAERFLLEKREQAARDIALARAVAEEARFAVEDGIGRAAVAPSERGHAEPGRFQIAQPEALDRAALAAHRHGKDIRLRK